MNRQLPQKSKENYRRGQETGRSGYYSGDSDFDSMTASEATTKGEQQEGSQEGTFDQRLNQKITLSKLNDDSSTNDQWIWLADVQRCINSGCSMDILESKIDRRLSNRFWGVWFC